jgi:hypothetical protein
MFVTSKSIATESRLGVDKGKLRVAANSKEFLLGVFLNILKLIMRKTAQL